MKLFTLIFALFLPLAAFAGNGSGNVSNVIGLGAMGVTTAPLSYFSPPAGVTTFSLFSGDNSVATAGNFYPFYKNGVAYQVTAAKTATCYNISSHTGTAGNFYQLVSATASFAFNAGSITGGVYQGGAAGKYPILVYGTASVDAAIPGTYAFGASTYAGWQAGNSQIYGIHMDCYEN